MKTIGMEPTTEIIKKMKIKNCSLTDADTILALYDAAVDLQTQKNMVVWPRFEKSLVEKEIWEERDNNNSIYIHRIATNPAFRGNRFIDAIVAWVKAYALSKGKQYVRLDTLGNNTKLIQHYTSAGFSFLGIFKLKNTKNLAAHYHKEPNCCLFEMVIN